MNIRYVEARVGQRGYVDGAAGRPPAPRAAIREQNLAHISPYHYRLLCRRYEQRHAEGRRRTGNDAA